MGSRGSSLVDYVLASQDLFQCISKFEVEDPNIISDHCLISFCFDFDDEVLQDSLLENYEYVMVNLYGSQNLGMNTLQD